MFHLYFCENRDPPEAIIYSKSRRLRVRWCRIGEVLEAFLLIPPEDEGAFLRFKRKWEADNLTLNSAERFRAIAQRNGFVPSGLGTASVYPDSWSDFRRDLEAAVWLLLDREKSPVTDDIRIALLRRLRGDDVIGGWPNATVQEFRGYLRRINGTREDAERALVDKFVRALEPLRGLNPLRRLQMSLRVTVDGVPPYHGTEERLLEVMRGEMEPNFEPLRRFLGIRPDQTPVWGYPAAELFGPCVAELAYCIEHNYYMRRCASQSCNAWFVIGASNRKYCPTCHGPSRNTVRWREKVKEVDPRRYAEMNRRRAWSAHNIRRKERGQRPVSLYEYSRRNYRPRPPRT